MKKYLLAAAAVAVGFTAIRCTKASTDDAGTTVSYTAGGLAFKAVDAALGSAEGLIGSGARSISSSSQVHPMTSGLTAQWEIASSYPNPKYEPACTSVPASNITLKEYMGTQFESSEKRCNGSSINIFGRLDNSAGIICIIMNSLSAATSAELAGAADATITLDAATKADLSVKCPMMAADLASEDGVPTGTVATLQFDAPGVTSTYDLKVVIQPFNNTVFMKYGGTETSIATNEDNSNGNQRVLVNYNSTTQVLRAEYVSKAKYTSDAPLYVHRLFMDNANSEARILSAIYTGYTSQTDTSEARSEMYVVSGHPSSNSIALSIKLLDMGSVADGTYEACVNGDTGAITNDAPTVSTNSFDCGTTASTSKAIPYVTALSTINGQTDDATPTTWWTLSTGSEVLSWTTRDNMLTSGL